MLQTPPVLSISLNVHSVVNLESEGLGTIHVLSAGLTYRGPMYYSIVPHDDKYRYLNRMSQLT